MKILPAIFRIGLLVAIESAVIYGIVENVMIPSTSRTFEFVGVHMVYALTPILILISLVTLYGPFRAGRILVAFGLLLGPAAFINGLVAGDSLAAGFLFFVGMIAGLIVASIGFMISRLGTFFKKGINDNRDTKADNKLYVLVGGAMVLPFMVLQVLFSGV